jgi:hypothetical protein
MPNGSAEGLRQAVDAFQGDAEDAEAAGGDLFGEVTGALDAPSPLSALFEPRKGGGRPKGSPNRMTTQTAQWLLSQVRHPLLVLAEAYSMSPAELAQRIGLASGRWEKAEGEKEPRWVEGYSDEVLLQLFKMQMGFAADLAPYVAKKQPQAIDLSAGAGGDFTLAVLGVSLPARGGVVGNPGGVIDGETLRLPSKSDD